MPHLGPARLDQQKGHRLLALPHEDLPGGGAQRTQQLGQGQQLLGRTPVEHVHLGQRLGAQCDHLGRRAQCRRQAVIVALRRHAPSH